MTSNPEHATQPLELTMVRVFDAPRALVWTAWTEPQHAMQWWGPDGFTTPRYELELRPGGAARVDMRAPDGTIFPNIGVVEEVVAPERLVTSGLVEIGGSHAFDARTTVTFVEHDGKTTVTVHQTYTNVSAAARDSIGGAEQGWTQMFGRLEVYLRTTPR